MGYMGIHDGIHGDCVHSACLCFSTLHNQVRIESQRWNHGIGLHPNGASVRLDAIAVDGVHLASEDSLKG